MGRFPIERNREGRISGSMRRFSQVIDEIELKDLSLQGGPFTWKGGLNNQRMAHLDRFLVTDDWDLSVGGARQFPLPRPTSDHFPVMLEGGDRSIRGPSPFRFENMWLQAEGFKNLINGCWHNIEVRGLAVMC